MGRGLTCQVCRKPMYAGDEKYEPKGTWVTYICRWDECPSYKRSGRRFQEKKFEPK
jgi:hypothetical protein